MAHNDYVSALLTHICFLGFVFSEDEQTALEQFEGGPCAVIAPVQVLNVHKDPTLTSVTDSLVFLPPPLDAQLQK